MSIRSPEKYVLTDTNVSFIVCIITDTKVFVNGKEEEMTFAEHLLELRKKSGLKQTEIAEIVGISFRTYQTYERGEREPGLSVLIALADYYNISLDDLACREFRGK